MSFLWLSSGLLVVLLAGGLLVGCTGQDPAGPVINNSGDGNTFNIPGNESNGNSVTTPAPVIVPPVVLTTPPEETQ